MSGGGAGRKENFKLLISDFSIPTCGEMDWWSNRFLTVAAPPGMVFGNDRRGT